MIDPRMLEVLALTSLLLLVVVIGGLLLQFGVPTNFSQIAHFWAKPSPTPLIAQRSTTDTKSLGLQTRDIAPAFPPVVVPSPAVSVFAPVLQPVGTVSPQSGFSDKVGAMISPEYGTSSPTVIGSGIDHADNTTFHY